MEYLKIKDDVDLKELEKFGAEKEKNSYYFRADNASRVIRVWSTRKISFCGTRYTYPICTILFDLIQAGLVEKVVE